MIVTMDIRMKISHGSTLRVRVNVSSGWLAAHRKGGARAVNRGRWERATDLLLILGCRITVERRVAHPGANPRASQGMGVARHRGVVERISGCQWCATLTGSDARHVLLKYSRSVKDG